ncbi:MAG: hypothetical protein ACYCOS_03880 [Sulfobacillus sp.]
MDQEMKAYLDAMQQGIIKQMVDLNTETRSESREHGEQLHTQARILIEAVHDDIRLVAEGVAMFNEKLDRIAGDHEERIQRLERGAL